MVAVKILFCALGWQQVADRVFAHIVDAEIVRCGPDTLLREARTAEVLIPTMTRVTAATMDAAPRLKLIQQAGVGLEAIDIAAATARGIMVANVPSVVNRSDASVAELAVIHMLVLARRYNEAAAHLKARDWGQPEGTLLLGKTAGIVGLGGIGRAIARRLRGFEMRVMGLATAASVAGAAFRSEAVVDWLGDSSQLDYLLAESDFVVLSATANESTYHLMNAERLSKMKRSAFLINVARGGLVDYEALEGALKNGQIAGAGLDVFDEEPVNPNASLFLYNVSATPHIGATTDIAFDGIGKAVAENVRRLRAGEPVLNCVNEAGLALLGRRRL